LETIVIIDSGVESTNTDNVIGGISILLENEEVAIIEGEYKDDIGHGTAIYNIINDACEDVCFFIIKIFNHSFECDQRLLLQALLYVYENVNCNFIIISSGAIVFNNYSQIKSIISKLYNDKGIIIVAAFNNEGALSYPASDENVIGVDSSSVVSREADYYILKGSPIDILSREFSFRLKWKDGKKIIDKGNSYIAALFASKIINAYKQLKTTDKNLLLDFIKHKNNVLHFNRQEFHEILYPKYLLSADRKLKAIAFPFSKEMGVIAANEDLLKVDIVHYCDIRQSGRIGLKVKDLIKHSHNEKTIMDIESINWSDDFDLVICGHCDLLSMLTNKNWLKTIYELSVKNKKYIYFFDHYDSDYINQFSTPLIESFTGYSLGKLWQCNSPVLGIFGTSRKQGKFTLQLELRRRFLSDGYNVQQISTEPSGCLFGIEYTCPIGYNASIRLRGNETAIFFNEIIHNCDLKDPDIIIVGCQSGTIPHNNFHESFFTFTQYEFLVGTSPDAVILLINLIDEISYIRRTISFIESAIDCEVIACVISPVNNKNIHEYRDEDELAALINKPVLRFNEIDKIYNLVISYFSPSDWCE